MPKKHPNTTRWGGPGASHEDAGKPMPQPGPAHPPGAVSTNPRVSQVSGGGGERDEKHSHVDAMRHSKSHATDSPSPTSTRDWRPNRSRRSRAAEAERQAGEHSEPAEAAAGPSIQINTDEDIAGGEALADRIEAQVARSLRRFQAQLTRVEVFLGDDNAAKTGGKRCSIEARPRGMSPLAASDSGADLDQAVSGALRRLARLLDSELGRRRDHKGGESVRTGAPGS